MAEVEGEALEIVGAQREIVAEHVVVGGPRRPLEPKVRAHVEVELPVTVTVRVRVRVGRRFRFGFRLAACLGWYGYKHGWVRSQGREG